jgi:hypothetical protein
MDILFRVFEFIRLYGRFNANLWDLGLKGIILVNQRLLVQSLLIVMKKTENHGL